MKTGDDASAANAVYDDKAWKSVTLPNAFNEEEAFAKDIHELSTGITWYRKHFKLPAGAKPKHVLVEFEGVRHVADVWVNGEKIGFNENGVMAFGFDISKALLPGDNVIAVRVDNDWAARERSTGTRYQWADKNFYANYGGINKPVTLHLTGGVYQTLPLWSSLNSTGVYVYGSDYDIAGKSATITAESEVRNDTAADRTLTYGVEIRDLDGKRVAAFDGGAQTLKAGQTAMLKASQRVGGLNFWSWGYGYLYTVTTTLTENGKVIDAVDTRTGFRATEFKDGMVKLNGRTLLMKGYAQRSTNEWPAVGISVPPWVSDFGNTLMLEGNGNLVRWMHVTPGKQEIESADRLGLIQAMPAGDSEGDPQDRRFDLRVELMRDAIIYNRNNPSILFYEGGNKGITEDHMARIKAVRDQYDPNGGRAVGSREMLDSKIAEYGGEMLYINKSKSKPLWAMEYSRDEAARAYQDDFTPPLHKDSPAYNRNVETIATENVKRWWDFYRYRPGTGERVSAGGVNIGFTDSNSHFRGDNNYRRSGEVDAVRLPKDSLWVHKVMWDGWVNSEGYHTHIIGHWTYAAGVTKNIFVASNGDSVELFVNGRSLGKGEKSDGFLFTFKNIAFVPGELKAVATYADGKTSEDTRKTAGPPAAVKLTPITGPRGFVADGADLMLVDVEVVDKDGDRVPIAFNAINFKLDGAAVWKGGIAQDEGVADKKKSTNYVLSTRLPVEGGINRVLIRSTTKAGKVTLQASADGLTPASITTATKAIAVKDGLSPVFAEDTQPVNLKRGPTPLTPSFSAARRGVTVATITAGSNPADAVKSHDDDERSTWNSDGTAGTAWIEYDLGTAQEISGVSLRMTGWRVRTYPLKITLDDKVVYQGTPEKSLGYVDLDFPVQSGRRLKIALTAPTEDRDGFGNIIEVTTDRQGASTGAEKVKTGHVLSIVEADILGPAN
ncbi:beta-galactosidase [Asticcacaulis solisilvae]|nr:beta-galactosidase [Asticcacaulis solisilvae]MDR6802019.1 beta-galactosidase [Asticcacaulis sp. BE141]